MFNAAGGGPIKSGGDRVWERAAVATKRGHDDGILCSSPSFEFRLSEVRQGLQGEAKL